MRSYSPLAVKGVMVFFDLGTLSLILLLLRERRLDVRWALLYGLNPVILYSFAGQGHLDSVQVFFLTGAVYLYRRKRWVWMFVAAGLAFQAKYIALIGWPFFVRRENVRHAWAAIAVATLPFLYFLPSDGMNIWDSLFRFGHEFASGGGVHSLARGVFGAIEPATRFCQILFAVAWLAACWHYSPQRKGSDSPDPVNGLIFVVGAFLILSPTIHFWYLSLIIPFVTIRPTTSWLILCGTIAFSFVAVGYQHETGSFFLPTWALVAVWTAPFLSMLVDIGPAIARWRQAAAWPTPRTVSVVIPTLNEESRIRDCIEAMSSSSTAVKEILVVDGGSTDATSAVAEACGAKTFEHKAPVDAGGGRGGQILAGCRKATGDVIAIVHADTRVAPGAFAEILDVLAFNPDIPGGSIGAVFDASRLKLRLLELANDLRSAFLGLSFGDQVQFFRREPAMSQNVVPSIPLMEDVELSLRLRRLGRPVFLWGECLVSARRWLSGPRFSSLLVIRIVAEYLLRRLGGSPDVVATYRRYYGGL